MLFLKLENPGEAPQSSESGRTARRTLFRFVARLQKWQIGGIMGLLAWRRESAAWMSGRDLAVRWCTDQGETAPNKIGRPAPGYSVLSKERPMSLQDAIP